MLPHRKHTLNELRYIFSKFLRDPKDEGFNEKAFTYQFENVNFKGRQTVVLKPNPNNKGGYTATIQNTTHPSWEKDILEKLRSIILASGKSPI